MSLSDAYDHQWDESDEELAVRLRELSWPELSPEFRDRCWLRFERLLDDFEAERAADSQERLDYTVRQPLMSGLVASRRLDVSRGWSRARLLRPALIAR
jgi:hypothetical protein